MSKDSFFDSFIILLNQILDKNWFFEINTQQKKVLKELKEFFEEMQEETQRETFESFLRNYYPYFNIATDYLLSTVTILGGFFRENAVLLADYLFKMQADYQRYYRS